MCQVGSTPIISIISMGIKIIGPQFHDVKFFRWGPSDYPQMYGVDPTDQSEVEYPPWN